MTPIDYIFLCVFATVFLLSIASIAWGGVWSNPTQTIVNNYLTSISSTCLIDEIYPINGSSTLITFTNGACQLYQFVATNTTGLDVGQSTTCWIITKSLDVCHTAVVDVVMTTDLNAYILVKIQNQGYWFIGVGVFINIMICFLVFVFYRQHWNFRDRLAQIVSTSRLDRSGLSAGHEQPVA